MHAIDAHNRKVREKLNLCLNAIFLSAAGTWAVIIVGGLIAVRGLDLPFPRAAALIGLAVWAAVYGAIIVRSRNALSGLFRWAAENGYDGGYAPSSGKVDWNTRGRFWKTDRRLRNLIEASLTSLLTLISLLWFIDLHIPAWLQAVILPILVTVFFFDVVLQALAAFPIAGVINWARENGYRF